MRYTSFLVAAVASVALAAPTFAQNVETRVQTRVETQVDTVVKSGSGQSSVDISYDDVAFNANGFGKSEKDAAVDAYYAGLKIMLRQLAGMQAEGSIGQKFRDDLDRDFNTFKRRYFSADTAHVCRPQDRDNKPIPATDKKTPVAGYACRADGAVNMLALKQDFEKEMKSIERKLSNALTFIVGAAEAKDPAAPFVVDTLSNSFTSAGFKVISASAQDGKLMQGDIDFSLAINAVEFAEFSYSPNEQLLTGALTVRFKLIDLKNSIEASVKPVAVKQSIRGANSDPVRVELRKMLANAAAVQIGRDAAATVVKLQENKEADAKAEERKASGQKQYVLRVVGISQRDRKQLADLRNAIKSAVPDAVPEVNTAESNDTRVTLNFTTGAAKLDVEDVVDKLFDTFKATKSFDAKYSGNNEFSVTF
jgi:hypothetical protein